MAHTYKSLISSGGCRIAYVWIVAGYPWGVCSDNALVGLLSNPETDSDASYARIRIFGEANTGSRYCAYDALMFDTLHPELGNQTYKTGAIGFADVSGWSLKILDKQLGAQWPHIVDGDSIWGIEGLHRIADLDDEVHGWGFLNGSASKEDELIAIHEESGLSGSGPLYDRITSLGDYRYIWIGHECIAVHGASVGSYPDYSADILARGVFRSNPQYHFVDAIEQVHQIVADVPQTIIGHYCYLWAIPLTPDGQFYHDDFGNPIIVLESSRCGIVSESITTDKGVTQVKINPCFDALKNKVSYEVTDNIVGHLGKYTFCRGDSGTSWEDIVSKRQKPHLYLYEYEAISGATATLPQYVSGKWTVKPIWLCGKGEVVQFDTTAEIAEALNEELFNLHLYYISNGASGTNQNTGDGTSGNEYVGLVHEYFVVNSYEFSGMDPVKQSYVDTSSNSNPMWFLKQTTGGGNAFLVWNEQYDAPQFGKWSMAGGILQAILGLGLPHIPDSYRLPVKYRSKCNYNIDFIDTEVEPLDATFSDFPFMDTAPFVPGKTDESFQFMESIYLAYIGGIDPITSVPIIVQGRNVSNHGYTVAAGLCQRPEVVNFNAAKDMFCAEYFLGWDWINHPVTDILSQLPTDAKGRIDSNGKLYACEDPSYPDCTFWVSRTNPEQFVSGTKVKIGQYTSYVDSWHYVDGYGYLEVSDDANVIGTSDRDAVAYGSCLISIPAYSLPSDSEKQDINDPEKIAEAYNQDTDDPFRITIFRESFCESVVDVIQAFLGFESSELWIPQHERRYFIPFFGVNSSIESFIDWDSLYSLVDNSIASLIPVVPRESFVIKTELDTVLKMFGVGMYEDYSFQSHQFVWRFRKYGNPVASIALNRGRIIGSSDLIEEESVEEDHLVQPIFNRIELKISDEKKFLIGDDETREIVFENRDVNSVVDREILSLKLEPSLFVLKGGSYVDSGYEDSSPKGGTSSVINSITNAVDKSNTDLKELTDHFVSLLYRLGQKKVTQKRSLLISSRFRSQSGLESLITDPMAHYPNTHKAGLESSNVLITEQKVDLTKNIIEISYLVSGDNSIHGYAPSCRVHVDEIAINADGFSCVPESTYSSIPVNDIFYFDCFDISDPTNPVPRTDSCGDYSVLVYSQDNGVSADNPLQGTCKVENISGTWTLRIYCDESKLPSTGYIVITYGTYDSCEADQKLWLFFSDSDGRVGTEGRRGDVWR